MRPHRGAVAPRRLFSAALIIGLGVLLSVVPLWHLTTRTHAPLGTVLDLVPTAFGTVVVAGGVYLYLGPYDAPALRRIFGWVAAGTLVVGLAGGVAVAAKQSGPPTVAGDALIVLTVAAVGATAGLVVGNYDGASRCRAAAVLESEARFNAVFDGALDPMLIADDDGTYVAANDAATDLFGVDRDALVGMCISDFADPTFDFDGEWSRFRATRADRGYFELLRPDGERRVVEFAATSDIYPGHHLSALRDVTDRLNYERAMARRSDDLTFLNRLVRHHVLNGMQVVLGATDRLLSNETHCQSDDLAVIRDRGEALVSFVNRSKRFSDVLDGRDTPRVVTVSPVLDEVLQRVRDDSPTVRFDISPVSASTAVVADTRLTDVFEHLLSNAIQHNDAPDPHIDVHVLVGPETVVVAVADNGSGIPATVRQRVFDPSDTSLISSLSGFGLYTVARVLEDYGGEVSISDNDPRGSIVTIELPRARLPATP
jgi:PAS domain S-box-containing protein